MHYVPDFALSLSLCLPQSALQDGTVATMISRSRLWTTVIADLPLVRLFLFAANRRNDTAQTEGVHKWEIEILRIHPASNISIGVCEPDHATSKFLGSSTDWQSFGYYGSSGGVRCSFPIRLSVCPMGMHREEAAHTMQGYFYGNGASQNYGERFKPGDVITVEVYPPLPPRSSS